MGSGASIAQLGNWSAEDIGKLVANLGPVYVPYSKILVDNGVNGAFIITLKAEDDIKKTLSDLGITKPIHVNIITSTLMKVIKADGESSKKKSADIPDTSAVAFTSPDVPVGDSVTRTPRSIMNELFQIQGIALDPSDIDPAIEKIVRVVGAGFGNGETKYDCFINYRVAADADLAEKIYLSLRAQGIYAFLDKKCLKDGQKWKDGFLTGLKNSRVFLGLISKAALNNVREFSLDHTYDNVLLEYETALKIMNTTSNPKYICPVHVGALKFIDGSSTLMKFSDFSSSLYPDSITKIDKPADAVKKPEPPPPAAPPAPPAPSADHKEPVVKSPRPPADDEKKKGGGEEEEEEDDGPVILCNSCESRMGPIKQRTESWQCTWPGHDEDAYGDAFDPEDSAFGCKKCAHVVICEYCWDDLVSGIKADDHEEDSNVVDQPRGTVSRYNENYYCEVLSITDEFKEHDNGTDVTLSVHINVRGDGSLGAIQPPEKSRLLYVPDEGSKKKKVNKVPSVGIITKDKFQILAVLTFKFTDLKDVESDYKSIFQYSDVFFTYGVEGYKAVRVFPPGSKFRADIAPVDPDGHKMVIHHSNDPFCCDICSKSGTGERWRCPDGCDYDVCFDCNTTGIFNPTCTCGSFFLKRVENDPTEQDEEDRAIDCSACSREQINLANECYRCGNCDRVLCLPCAAASDEREKREHDADAEDDDNVFYGDDDEEED